MPNDRQNKSASLAPLLAACLVLLGVTQAHALELPVLIGDGMVVQRDQPIPVWGRAEAGSTIRVQFNRQQFIVITDDTGVWQVNLPELPAGGPYTLAVEGEGRTYRFSDVWVGDVWVCSGQSNMEWPLFSTENAEAEIASVSDGLIRHFKVPKSWASTPQDELAGGTWKVNSAETAGDFTAVGYYFANRLRDEVDVPIGLINTTWGGSNIESWMDASLLGLDPERNEMALEALAAEEEAAAAAVRQQLDRWPGSLVDDYSQADADWSAPDLDVSGWVEIEAPALWEESGYQGLDGVAWFRKSFELTKEQATQDLELGLARIDDHDITWVNGRKVGETRIYNETRQYTVDQQFLREGVNVIAIRVLDTGGGGGIWSEPELLYVRSPVVELSLAGTWLFRVDRGAVLAAGDRNQTPTALYNRMLNPLFRIPVRGVIWYQGESNAFETGAALAYREQFKALIQDWRARWNDDGLPFYWVQLANFISGADTETDSPWAVLRESQTGALSLPHTGQAVIIDVGDPDDIHPRDKRTVGDRLARHALQDEYGIEGVITDGPYASSARAEGSVVTVEFTTQSELRVPAGEAVTGFELADAAGDWRPAAGNLEGRSVTLNSADVEQPVAVRYAWSDNPETANLTDESGLPANPFRLNLDRP